MNTAARCSRNKKNMKEKCPPTKELIICVLFFLDENQNNCLGGVILTATNLSINYVELEFSSSRNF